MSDHLRVIVQITAILALSCLTFSAVAAEFIDLPAGRVIMGDPAVDPGEVRREVQIKPFRLMRYEVTNQAFADFIRESGHRTDPEKSGSGYVWTERWQYVEGADWQHPYGPETTIKGADDHPVVQVSAGDAAAFCAFYGWRLPSEEEWEYAARGGDGRRYPWGDQDPDQTAGSDRLANFGTVPCCAADNSDGYLKTAPVGRFPKGAGPFGHLDLAGNVWEWTSSRFPGRPDQIVLKGGGWGNNPHCLRASYRHGNPPDIGLDMVGFRCVADPSMGHFD
ncbi:MAG: formylglycine-generating enzyme family protein [Geminicoccaceae bacterium]